MNATKIVFMFCKLDFNSLSLNPIQCNIYNSLIVSSIGIEQEAPNTFIGFFFQYWNSN